VFAVPAVLELSRSESTLGSAAFAARELWGPATPSAVPWWPVVPVVWVVEVEWVVVVEWSLFKWSASLTLLIAPDILKMVCWKFWLSFVNFVDLV
jgi:hypothetical protein